MKKNKKERDYLAKFYSPSGEWQCAFKSWYGANTKENYEDARKAAYHWSSSARTIDDIHVYNTELVR